MIAYPAMLDVPRELVQEVARLLRAERRSRGTRTGSRVLNCWNQALMVLAWFRNHGDIALVGAGFRVSRATSYRYRDEVVDVLADQAPDLHDALSQVAAQGWSHIVVDGKVFRQGVPHRPHRRDHHQRQGRNHQHLVLGQAPRLRRQRAGHHAPRRATGLGV